MNEAVVLKKVKELSELVTSSPVAGAVRDTGTDGMYLPVTSTERGSVEVSLGNLQLQIKYVLFDLEATRRENRYLRQMLENRPRRKGEEDSEDKRDWT